MPNKPFYRIIQIIQLIASDCEVQIESFPEYVHMPDEIAQILADTLTLFEAQVNLDSRDTDFLKMAKQLDNYFADLSKDKFTLEALCTSQEWDKARELAQEILEYLGLARNKPDLGWLKFIKG